MTREALKMALEALEGAIFLTMDKAALRHATINAIEAALAEPDHIANAGKMVSEQEPVECMCGICKLGSPQVMSELEQEPVAWMYEVNGAHTILDLCEPPDDAYDEGTLCPLYTAPPKRQPCQTCESLARAVMMDQTGRDA
jgi:hypothetical protein